MPTKEQQQKNRARNEARFQERRANPKTNNPPTVGKMSEIISKATFIKDKKFVKRLFDVAVSGMLESQDGMEKLITARYYSLVTVNRRDAEPQHFIVFEPRNAKARRFAQKWLTATLADGFDDFNVNSGDTITSTRMAETCLRDGRIIPIE